MNDTVHPAWCTRDRERVHTGDTRHVPHDPTTGAHAATHLCQWDDEPPLVFLAVAASPGNAANLWLTLAQANLLGNHLCDLVAAAGAPPCAS